MDKKYFQDLKLLDDQQNAICKEKMVCDMIQQLWGDLMAIPPKKAAAILRLLMASEEN
ncbi:hypothetical protein [Kosakonia cowanii]|uniref:hypothetical protein n=1 Tax=Kosakonia cowanii TaxID=208223 RepID=UPI0039B0D0B9